MNYIAFDEWLQNKKNLSERSAKDVICRCRRVKKMTKSDNISCETLMSLVASESFNNKSKFIKSQLKRAVKLYLEFEGEEMNQHR